MRARTETDATPLMISSSLSWILLDASNLQLGLRPSLISAHPDIDSFDTPKLAARLDKLAKALGGSGLQTEAVFDAGAFGGVHEGARWLCEPDLPDANPLTISFTSNLDSADDALVGRAQEIGEAAGAPRPAAETAGHARTLLESELASPRPVFAVTLLKSASGKSKRDKREAFLRTVGLTRMGDTVHLPTFDATQQERSLALMRGLKSLERGVLRVERLDHPAALVVSDDRGLRRRCFNLPNPPVVFGRSQFLNALMRDVDSA